MIFKKSSLIVLLNSMFLLSIGIVNIQGQSIANKNIAGLTDKLVNGEAGEDKFRHVMEAIPESSKFDIVRDKSPALKAPDNDGWYYSVAGIASTPTGLVATYRKSDAHTANTTDIMVAYSSDGGRTWSGHNSIAHADVWNEEGVWIAPQLSKLKNGKLVIIADYGNRDRGDDWPKLSDWQKPGRGMSNHLFWSDDNGKTWKGPIKIDDVGGEPGYILELTNGTLLYTRTQSKKADELWNPPMPWGKIYYTNEVVASTDGGKTWKRRSILSKDKYHGDCEVGLEEIEPGKVMAVTRIGFGNGQFGQPSRIFYSNDGGKTWEPPVLSPFYAQRPIVHKLQSGNVVMTYRNRWGTPGNYAVVFDPTEELPYEPNSYMYDPSRCLLKDEIMTIKTDEGFKNQVTYAFYPAQAPDSRVEIEAEIKVEEADINGVNISAGVWIRFEPDKISLGDRPKDSFSIDATEWHRYRIVRENKTVSIYVDGQLKLKAPTDGIETRLVQIGNRRSHRGTKSLSHWRALEVKVNNKRDYDIDWTWNPANGYPDQFRRDRIVLLDRIADSPAHTGYGDVIELEDGTIVIADYTVGGNGGKPASMPFIRAYITSEEELTN